jgi:uncharacterized protein
MLKIELRSLEHEDLLLKEKGWAQALGVELTPELSPEPLEVYCALSKIEDLVSAKGWVMGKMLLTCDRCLKDFESPYKSFFEIHYRPQTVKSEPEEETPDALNLGETEIVYFEGDILDIADQIRQTILLSVPMRALCREDCRGLCGGCGCDLNEESCQCAEPPTDSRWGSLKKWKSV